MAGVKYRGDYISYEWDFVGSMTPFFNTARFKDEIKTKLKAELRREGEIVQRAFERTVKTWDTPVEFKIERMGMSSDGFYVEVTTDSEIYRFINDGTSIRYATMPKGYRPKSQVRVIGSRSGGGEPLFINKKVPRPGIVAREYVDEIANRRAPYFYNNMERVFNRIFEKYFTQSLKGR